MNEDIVAIIATAILIGIPFLAISTRIALKPVVDAIVRMREGVNSDTAAFQARRIERLEAEVEGLREEVGRLGEVRDFYHRLAAPAPGSGSTDPEGPAA